MDALARLIAEVEARADSLATGRDWPCHAGCDGCCRRLAVIPALTGAEWALLAPVFAALPADRRADIRARALALADHPAGALVSCPFLDGEAGLCQVYAGRPAACRSYGFYRGARHDAFCGLVEAALPALEADGPLLFGNQDALDARLDALGGRVDLVAWFRDGPGAAG
ncbi:MAG: YkgJ family cysteine cluster protein [Myxococcales bacterium]|nr:YkgJ family cysteine cluster protein [Myxococcales bacterium]